MKIRKIKFQDVGAIARIHINAWKSAYKNILPKSFLDSFNYDERQKLWETWIKEKKTNTYIIENKDQIIGYISGIFNNYTWKLFGLYIDPEYIGKGIGSKLFNYIENNFNIYRIELLVLEGNKLGIDFYLKKGFEFTGNKEILKINNKNFNELEMVRNYKKIIK